MHLTILWDLTILQYLYVRFCMNFSYCWSRSFPSLDAFRAALLTWIALSRFPRRKYARAYRYWPWKANKWDYSYSANCISREHKTRHWTGLDKVFASPLGNRTSVALVWSYFELAQNSVNGQTSHEKFQPRLLIRQMTGEISFPNRKSTSPGLSDLVFVKLCWY